MKSFNALAVLALAACVSSAPAPAFTGFPGFPFPPGGVSGGGSGGGTGGGSGVGFGGGSSTANDVTDNAPCKELTAIFARGTGEPGNIGAVVGSPLLSALQSKLTANIVAYQGVPYAASAQGNVQQGGDGGSPMTSLTQQALSQCPSTKVVLSGYSQGGFVVHVAAQSLSSGQFVGAVIFGDPENGQAVANLPASALKEYCAQGDGICGTPRTYQITPAHTSYGSNAADAAKFIAGLL